MITAPALTPILPGLFQAPPACCAAATGAAALRSAATSDQSSIQTSKINTGAVAFTSCNVNDEIQDNVAVRFTAGIGEQAVVDNGGIRAAGTD